MYWQEWSEKLKKELKLETDPIAVTFAGAPTPGTPPPHGKVSVCQALKKASEGEPVAVTAETCGCPGGLVNLGLGQTPAAGKEKLVDFLVNKEKVYCSRVAIHRSQQTVKAPAGMASCVTFVPLSKTSSLPDVVAFVGKPGSLHHLLSFAGYWEGGSMKAELIGPACKTGITYPVVTGEIGMSLFDFGARRLAGFADEHLMITVPFHRLLSVMQALEKGIGREGAEDRETIERRIDELGKVEPV